MDAKCVVVLLFVAALGCGQSSAGDVPSVETVGMGSVVVPDDSTPRTSASVQLAFVGDIALTSKLGRLVARRLRGQPVDAPAAADHFPFDGIVQQLQQPDLLMGNLECVASAIGTETHKATGLRCPVLTLRALRRAGFDLVSVANNHTLDYGTLAFADMLQQLQAAELTAVGAASMRHLPQAVVVRSVRGVRIGFLAYYRSPRKPYSDVTNAKVDVLVVYNHWGREHQVEPMPQQRQLAHELIDAGADIVVGTHAHVVQSVERYRGKLIAYGLGNFVFDAMPLRDKRGALLEVSVSRAGVLHYQLVSTWMDEHLRPQTAAGGPTVR